MPAVAGRSCDACRARKKKCDQAQPSCSRCSRLNLRCVGSGTQRFKFHNATATNPRHTPVGRPSASRPLHNHVTATIGSLVQTLEVDDPRFCIVSLGGFLEDVPRRLGRNEALDAAAKAFSATMAVVRTGSITVPMLTEYGVALGALRRLFAHGPARAVTVETLVAIYLVMICQNWMGGSRAEFSVHIHGLVHILNSEAARDWNDSFSRQILGITSLLAVSEAVTNHDFRFDPQFVAARKAGPVPAHPRQTNISDPETIKLENLLNYPQYLNEPDLHLDEIRQRYDQARLESHMLVHLLGGMLAGAQTASSSPSPPPASFIRMYVQCESGAATLMSIAMMLNQILRIFSPRDALLEQDMAFFTSQVMRVADRVKDLRPLGCTFVPPALCMGWVTTPSEDVKTQLGAWMEAYRADFRGAKSTDFTGWLEHRFGGMRARARTRTTAASDAGHGRGMESLRAQEAADEAFEVTGTRPCCVM